MRRCENYATALDELDAVISRSNPMPPAIASVCRSRRIVEQMRKQLAGSEAGSKLEHARWRRDNRAEMARSLANAQQTGEGAQRESGRLVAERDAYIQGWHADVSQKLARSQQQVERCAASSCDKAKLRKQLVELRSDRDAIVQSVAKVSVGSVLQSGQQFITLVPTDAPLEVESQHLRQR